MLHRWIADPANESTILVWPGTEIGLFLGSALIVQALGSDDEAKSGFGSGSPGQLGGPEVKKI